MTKFGILPRALLLLVLIVAAGGVEAKITERTGFIPSHSNPLDGGISPNFGGSFVVPNENYPIQGKKVFAALPAGVLISVGTERGPIALTMAENVTHLLQVDIDQKVVVYNRVNIALLKAAARTDGSITQKLEAYRTWKFNPSRILADVEAMKIADEEKELLKTVTTNPWWKEVVRATTANPFHSVEDRALTVADEAGPQFVGVKYWRDEKLAARIFAMADAGRMQAELLDLTDEMALQLLLSDLKQARLNVAGVDSSNVWFFESGRLKTMVRNFGALEPAPLFIFTWLKTTKHKHYRQYTGFTADTLLNSGYMGHGQIEAAYEKALEEKCEGLLL